MAELMMFRQDADGQDVELAGSTVALEVELQRRVEAGLEQMLGVRFLASEYPTGPWHRGRIDTLGLDENGSPVVIEFKKGSDSGVKFPQGRVVSVSAGHARGGGGFET
ncbi:hypothetical protein [Streptomyces sp. NBC_00441]|uniref:hypothetical protein n=1 Tax=Streptomyces sp. NBC_00441 TaxID=2975742 RepID=UPI003FCE93E0